MLESVPERLLLTSFQMAGSDEGNEEENFLLYAFHISLPSPPFLFSSSSSSSLTSYFPRDDDDDMENCVVGNESYI